MSLRQHKRAINTRYRSETTAQPFGKSVFGTLRLTCRCQTHNIRHDRSRSSQLGLLRLLRVLSAETAETVEDQSDTPNAARRGAGGALQRTDRCRGHAKIPEALLRLPVMPVRELRDARPTRPDSRQPTARQCPVGSVPLGSATSLVVCDFE